MLLIFFTLLAKGILKLDAEAAFFYFLFISFILMVITSSLIHLGKHRISRSNAVILSVWFPGLGQFYLKQRLSGLIFYITFLAVCYFGMGREVATSDAFLIISIFTFASALPAYLTVLHNGGKSNRGAQLEAVQTYRKLVPFLQKGFIPAPDTNMLMHDGLLFAAIYNDSDAPLMVSNVVIDELDNLKGKRGTIKSKRAQFAFDVLENFQAAGRMQKVMMPNHATREKLNFAHSNDDKIAAAYMNEFQRNKKPVVFLSNDKGARIIARNAGLPLMELDRKQTADPNLLNMEAVKGFSTGLAATSPSRRKFTSYLPRIEVPSLGGFLRIAVSLLLAFGLYSLWDKAEKADGSAGSAEETTESTAWEKPDFPIADLEVTEVVIEESEGKFSIAYEIINHGDDTLVFGYTVSEPGSEPERSLSAMKHDDGIQLAFTDGSVKKSLGGFKFEPKEKGKLFFSASEPLGNLKSLSMLIYNEDTEETIEWTMEGS